MIRLRYICLSIILLLGFAVTNFACSPPNIKATATVPEFIDYGQVFNEVITVTNEDSRPVTNLRAFSRANPAGYFSIRGADRPKVCMLTGGCYLDLGDLNPGEETTVTVTLKAPIRSDLHAKPTDFEFIYTATCNGSNSEINIGSIMLTVGE
jgi:hypothetical protein